RGGWRARPGGPCPEARRRRVFAAGEIVGGRPVTALVDECPLYELEPEAPAEPIYPAPRPRVDPLHIPADQQLLELLGSPSIASKRWAFEQYDSIVGSRSARRAGAADAAVAALAPDGGEGALAVVIDGNGRRVACGPYTGTGDAVLEC